MDDENDGQTADTAYATLAAAMAAAKAHLAKPGIKNVVINLAEGEYNVSETLTLTADEILADEYSFRVVGAGDSVMLASNIPHSIVVEEDALVIDVFTPLREEYI